jgi:hypothetical protein
MTFLDLVGRSGASDAACRAYPGSNIPSIAIPDFARNRLLARKIHEWSKG